MNESHALLSDDVRDTTADARKTHSLAPSQDLSDPFLLEGLFGDFLGYRLDKTEQALCEIEWIGGFSNTDRLQLEVFVNPVIRCLGKTPRTQSTYCSAIAPLRNARVTRAFALDAIDRLGRGCIIPLKKGRQVFDIPHYTAYYHERKGAAVTLDLNFSDEFSTVLPFRDIKRLRPDVAEAIELDSPCPESVSFYILDDEEITVAISTASILKSCFAPPQLAKHLIEARKPNSFVSEDVTFDGFQFLAKPRRCYPFRGARHLERAEFEVAQILPRAAAYKNKYGDLVPLLLRPPFAGKATLSGLALTISSGPRSVFAFCSGVSFFSRSARALEQAIQTSRFATKAFAPHLFRGISLPGLTRDYVRSQYFEVDEYCDIHDFPHASRVMHDEVMRGAIRAGPDVTFDVEEIIRLRNWCITRAWQGR